jgi:very-short-patch-repair endonuclease
VEKMEASKDNLHLYNTRLQPFANALRKRMTKAEACLWKFALRASQLKGYPFRRQRPVLNYIADFMCKDLMLIIEVDGITHQDEKVIANDKRRHADLENAGFTVLRFTDNQVLKSMTGVIAELEEWIENYEASKGHPPTPASGG